MAVLKVFRPVHVVRHEVGNRVLEWGLPVTAFAFEHCAAAYPRLARIFDLALGLPDPFAIKWFIVAPDAREDSIRIDFESLLFHRVSDVNVRFQPYRQLHRLRPADLLPGEGPALGGASFRALCSNQSVTAAKLRAH